MIGEIVVVCCQGPDTKADIVAIILLFIIQYVYIYFSYKNIFLIFVTFTASCWTLSVTHAIQASLKLNKCVSVLVSKQELLDCVYHERDRGQWLVS
jgi:hypothetical protein